MVRAFLLFAMLLLTGVESLAWTPGVAWWYLRKATKSEIIGAGLDPDYCIPGNIKVRASWLNIDYPPSKMYSEGDRIPVGGCVGIDNLEWWQDLVPGREEEPIHVMALDPPPCVRAQGGRTLIFFATMANGGPGFPPANRYKREHEHFAWKGGLYREFADGCCWSEGGCVPAEGRGCEALKSTLFFRFSEFCGTLEPCSEEGICDICGEYARDPNGYPDPDPFDDPEGGCDDPADCYDLPGGGPDPDIEINDCEESGVDPLWCCKMGDPDSDGDGICDACDSSSTGCKDRNYDEVCDDCTKPPVVPDEEDDFARPAVCKPSQTTFCCEAEGATDTDGDGICNRCDADVQQPPGNTYCVDVDPRDGICDGCQGSCNVCNKLDKLIEAITAANRYDEEETPPEEMPKVGSLKGSYYEPTTHPGELVWIEPFRFGAWDAPVTSFNLTIPVPGGGDVTYDLFSDSVPASLPSGLVLAMATLRNIVRAVLLAMVSYKFMFSIYKLVQTL